MRLLSLSSVALGVTFLAAAAGSSRAIAQIEFAHSTIRITSASEPASPAQPTATAPVQRPAQQSPRQQEANPYVTETAEQSAPPTPPTTPRVPIRRYDVRPVNYDAPNLNQPMAQPQLPGRAPSVVGVYGGASARATLNKMPGPTPVQPKAPAAPRPARGKPFQGAINDPAVSPYMNMYRNETNSNGLPNYFSLVRPQMEQLEANRQQAAELQKLRSQVQNLSSGGGSGAPQSPSMGGSAHYMDTAQFYRGMKR